MSKYIRVFFLTIMVSLISFFIFASLFMGGGDPAEEMVLTFGTLIVILLSFLISQVYYLIDLLKQKR